MFCSMLCVSKIIDILSWAEAGFKSEARFCTFFLDQFHSSFLVLAPCLTVSDSACSAGHVATAAIHAAGCIAAGCTCEFSDCPCPCLAQPLRRSSPRPYHARRAPCRSSSPPLLATAAAPSRRRRSSPPQAILASDPGRDRRRRDRRRDSPSPRSSPKNNPAHCLLFSSSSFRI